METNQTNKGWSKWENNPSPKGRILAGVIIIAVGALLLLKKMGLYFPEWVFTWQMLLITIGIFSGAKHSFRGIGWMIPIALGSFFLIEHFIPALSFKQYFWPLFLIGAGVYMIARPKRNSFNYSYHQKKKYTANYYSGTQVVDENGQTIYQEGNSEDYINVNCVFAGAKKTIISKNFKGGEANVVFGGAEIDLTQSDFNDKIYLEVNAVFGGINLVVPSNWQIHSEATAVLGSIDDKRPKDLSNSQTPKILVLKGAAVFGGIEIKSY